MNQSPERVSFFVKQLKSLLNDGEIQKIIKKLKFTHTKIIQLADSMLSHNFSTRMKAQTELANCILILKQSVTPQFNIILTHLSRLIDKIFRESNPQTESVQEELTILEAICHSIEDINSNQYAINQALSFSKNVSKLLNEINDIDQKTKKSFSTYSDALISTLHESHAIFQVITVIEKLIFAHSSNLENQESQENQENNSKEDDLILFREPNQNVPDNYNIIPDYIPPEEANDKILHLKTIRENRFQKSLNLEKSEYQPYVLIKQLTEENQELKRMIHDGETTIEEEQYLRAAIEQEKAQNAKLLAALQKVQNN